MPDVWDNLAQDNENFAVPIWLEYVLNPAKCRGSVCAATAAVQNILGVL